MMWADLTFFIQMALSPLSASALILSLIIVGGIICLGAIICLGPLQYIGGVGHYRYVKPPLLFYGPTILRLAPTILWLV
jgi:hypothetical protein